MALQLARTKARHRRLYTPKMVLHGLAKHGRKVKLPQFLTLLVIVGVCDNGEGTVQGDGEVVTETEQCVVMEKKQLVVMEREQWGVW